MRVIKLFLDFVPRLVLYFDDDSIVVMFPFCLFPFFQIKAILISLKWPEFGRNLFSWDGFYYKIE
jgi:hypothetical protein